jgi:taurine dioxygenase
MATIKVRNLSPAFGVEISGMETRIPFDAETVRTLRALFDERSLLIFRDIDADLKFQTYLSELLIGNDATPETLPLCENFYVSNKNPKSAAPFGQLLFHSDSMWIERGCELLSLYGEKVEQPSVPTLFVSNGQAWDTLPAELRARVEDRFAVHCQDATAQRRGAAGDVLVSSFEIEESVALPVGYPHPRTGRTLLYACPQMTRNILDMTPDDSEDLLEALFDHLYASQPVLEHQWREGDLLIWDNIALQHARPNITAEDPIRILRKTMAPSPKYYKGSIPKFSQLAEGERAS